MSDRTDYEVDPSDRYDDPPPDLREEGTQRLEESGFFDADDGYAHMDALPPVGEF